MTFKALLLFVVLALGGSEFSDPLRGFRIDRPEGWTVSERDEARLGHILTLAPPGSGGAVAVSVSVLDVGEANLAALIEEKLEVLAAFRDAGTSVGEVESFETRLDGRAATGLRFELVQADATYRLVQVMCVREGQLFTVQRHGPVDTFEAADVELAPVAGSFGFRPRDAEALRADAAAAELVQLAARCGMEVDWADDWADAASRARETGRPVLVVTWFLQAFAVAHTPRTTTFVDPDVIALVNSRFVPLWVTDRAALSLERQDGSPYGIGPSSFGQALLVVEAGGRVLVETHGASEANVAYAFLRSLLAREAERYPAPRVEPGLGALAAATALVDHGQLDAAWSVLERQSGLAATRQRARVLRLQRRAPEALAELTIGLSLLPVEPGERLLARIERAELLLGLGRLKEARLEAESVAEAAPEVDLALRSRALLDAGLVAYFAGDGAACRERLERVVQSFESTRWAPVAAFLLSSGALDLGIVPSFTPPNEAALAGLLQPDEPSVWPASDAGRAADEALDWLLAAQSEDGSFPVPSDFGYMEALGANPYADATAALAGRALLSAHAAGMGDAARAAAKRATEYVLRSLESRKLRSPQVLYMDYMTWSDAVMLDLVADAAEVELLPRAELAAAAKELIVDLAERRQDNGGWSYYKKTDLAADDVPAQSISFTTAGVSLALSHAKAAGFDVPESLRRDSTQALRGLRDANGVFAYFLYGSGLEPHPPIRNPRGDVGRGPACELALFNAGASDPERLAASVELFLDQAPLFTAQRGKALMHAGPEGQGCHYLYFDYLHAALAAAELPSDERRRTRIVDLVLDGRQADGSFLDTPILGHAYGTAMALRALIALKTPEE